MIKIKEARTWWLETIKKMIIRSKPNYCVNEPLTIHFEDGKMKTQSVDQGHHIMSLITARPGETIEATNDDVLNVDGLKLAQIIEIMNEDIVTLEQDKDKLVIYTGKKHAELKLRADNTENMNWAKPPTLAGDVMLVLDSKEISEVIKAAELTSYKVYEFEITEGKAVLTVGSLIEDNVVLRSIMNTKIAPLIDDTKKDFVVKARFGELIEDVFKVVSGEIEIHLKTDYPMIVKGKDKEADVSFEYIIAPRIEGEV